MFKINEKVVCINPIFNLIKNEIYTINGIVYCSCGHIMLTLKGIEKPDPHLKRGTLCNCDKVYNDNDLFGYHRFRKLDYEFATNIIKEITEMVLNK